MTKEEVIKKLEGNNDAVEDIIKSVSKLPSTVNEVETIPITEVLNDMGIKWWKGSEEEVKHTLKRLDEAVYKVSLGKPTV